VFDALELPPRIEFVDMPPALRDTYQYYTHADIGKLRAAGYTAPATPLRDAVADYVRNYLVPGRGLTLE
jgi:ADP-L-glycero-D-manno-heptose 6-epimerase